MITAIRIQETLTAMKKNGAAKPDIIRVLAEMCLGWPYVFGAAGEMCTPDNRKKYAGYRPDKKPDIYGACPALSGNGTCDDCKWCGTRIFDCRGFTRWLLAQVDLTLYGGTVTAQWDTGSNWVYKGTIDKMPLSLVSCVFREGHTGMHLFGDVTRHCSKYVKEQLLPGVPKWQRFGIPAGLYTDKELEAAGVNFEPEKNVPTIRRGSEGELVKQLQARLNELTGAGLTVDGIFGAKTESAVLHFQELRGLTADGIVGPKTWQALGVSGNTNPPTDNGNNEIKPSEPPVDEPDIILTDEIKTAMRAAYASAKTACDILRKLLEG